MGYPQRRLAAIGKDEDFDKLSGAQNKGPSIFEYSNIPSYAISILQRIRNGKTVGKTEKAKSVRPEITASIELCKLYTNKIINPDNNKGINKFLYLRNKMVQNKNIKKHRIIFIIT